MDSNKKRGIIGILVITIIFAVLAIASASSFLIFASFLALTHTGFFWRSIKIAGNKKKIVLIGKV